MSSSPSSPPPCPAGTPCGCSAARHHTTSSSSSKSDAAATRESPPPASLLPFGEWVAQRWHCSREANPVEYDRAVQLAETSLFGQPDEVGLAEEKEKQTAAAATSGSSCIPLGTVPKLGECASLSSVSVKDDRNPLQHPKPPLLDHLEDLAAEYFGRNWDRVEEIVELNQLRLEAWKASRTGGAKASHTIFPSGGGGGGSSSSPSSSSSDSSVGGAGSGKKKRGREGMALADSPSSSSTGAATAPFAMPATGPGAVEAEAAEKGNGDGGGKQQEEQERGEVVEIGEDAIDLLLGGLPGAAVENGKAASVPGLDAAEIILLEVYSEHCPACHLLRPTLRQAAQHFTEDPRILICAVEGPANPSFLERLDVQWYPTLKIIDRATKTVWDWPLPCTGNAATDVIQVLHRYLDRPKPDKHTDGTESPLPSAAMMPRLGGGGGGGGEQALSGVPLEQSVLRGLTPPRRNSSEDGDRRKRARKGEGEEAGGKAEAVAVQRLLAQVPENDHPPSFSEVRALQSEDVCRRDLRFRRRWVSAMEIFRALGCADEASCRALTRSHDQDQGEEPPHLILLGGGMGAGKTTLKRMVMQSEFYRRYGHGVVAVEADHFKAIDPVYQLLTRLNLPQASEQVHNYSTQAAEELFLSALKFRRDIVFDSTLAWEPFLAQTLAMVRDRQHSYRRGPGYVEQSAGGSQEGKKKTVVEQYWEVEGPVPPGQEPAPYRVELVGVYVRPEVAVRRAIIRRLLTGRGVPVRDQLRSHALFARNFEAFACCFDTVVLYDNNRRQDRAGGGGAGGGSGVGGDVALLDPRVIARKEISDRELQVVDPEAFRAFQEVAHINVDATCVEDLYRPRSENGAAPPPRLCEKGQYSQPAEQQQGDGNGR